MLCLQAKKSLTGGDTYLQSGWLSKAKAKKMGDRYIFTGEVKHSQRLANSSLHPWAAVLEDGVVLGAHCTCMAGLGEACSHISCLLKCIKDANVHRKQQGVDSCTSQPCSWLPPTKDVAPQRLSDIDFTTPKTKRQRTQKNTSGRLTSTVSQNLSKCTPLFNEEAMSKILCKT